MDEVRRIKVLSNLIQQGHQIGQLAHINTNELESLWSSLYSNGVTLPINNSISKQTKVLKIKSQDNSINLTLDQLSFYNIREMMNTIHQARLQSDARSFLLEFTAPLLGRLNFLVEQGKLDISHEHCLSAVLKYYLSDMFFQLSLVTSTNLKLVKKTTLIFATPENEYHEFGIQISACLAAIMGLNIFYLGCNVPVNSLVASAFSLGVSTVVLGVIVSNKVQAKNILKYLQKTSSELAPSMELWVGGNLIGFIPKEIKLLQKKYPKVRIIDSFLDFELLLQAKQN